MNKFNHQHLYELNYKINCLAMAIVNHTNEINGVGIETRQKNNDICFNFAVKKIEEFLFNTK